MAYDPIFSASRSRSRNVQRKNDKRSRMKTAINALQRLTRIYIRENIDLPRTASDFVRSKICIWCPLADPFACEELRNNQNRYYCRFLSKEYDAYVRLYLPKKRKVSQNSAHNREHTAKKIEALIRSEPGIRRTRIREIIGGKWETTLDILENDLVFQGRVNRTEKKERGKIVYQYEVKNNE